MWSSSGAGNRCQNIINTFFLSRLTCGFSRSFVVGLLQYDSINLRQFTWFLFFPFRKCVNGLNFISFWFHVGWWSSRLNDDYNMRQNLCVISFECVHWCHVIRDAIHSYSIGNDIRCTKTTYMAGGCCCLHTFRYSILTIKAIHVSVHCARFTRNHVNGRHRDAGNETHTRFTVRYHTSWSMWRNGKVNWAKFTVAWNAQ